MEILISVMFFVAEQQYLLKYNRLLDPVVNVLKIYYRSHTKVDVCRYHQISGAINTNKLLISMLQLLLLIKILNIIQFICSVSHFKNLKKLLKMF